MHTTKPQPQISSPEKNIYCWLEVASQRQVQICYHQEFLSSPPLAIKIESRDTENYGRWSRNNGTEQYKGELIAYQTRKSVHVLTVWTGEMISGFVPSQLKEARLLANFRFY